MTDSNFNLFFHFQKQFKSHAAKPLLVTGANIKYSYADIDKESARLANYLSNLGVQIGDRVSVQVHKSPEALSLYLACLRGGFVFHPLNTGYQSSELDYFLSNAAPAVVVCDSESVELMGPLLKKHGIANLLTLNADGSGSLIADSRSCGEEFAVVHRDKDDLAALLYSSGTTGVPKGIMLTHNNLLTNAQSLNEAWAFNEDDVLLHALPIFHVHGLFVALGCVLLSGASMRWLPGFNTDAVIELLPKCTVMMGVPTFYTRLLDSNKFDKAVVKNIRLFVSGSAPLLAETFNEFEQRTGHRILERYGMTETNMNTSNPLSGLRKAGTVGFALPGVDVRVVGESGEVLAPGEIGDLQVKGANVFKGYWKMPEKTAEDFTADGFFNTGDKGVISEDGYVSIVGRAKDLIITGGLNVYPKELELIIDDLPGVKESAVIGVPHKDFGEAIVAVIVADGATELSEEAIISAMKTSVANFKVPKKAVFLDELPRNTMGKVQKNVLRETFKALLA
ncbi:malonyl-CoA synthase [Zhongshania sp.]|uniref:malonate--CoA ligase n=1 Tax=Zhongshania sp. TaxID=1971902 RepID=UPI0035658A4F